MVQIKKELKSKLGLPGIQSITEKKDKKADKDIKAIKDNKANKNIKVIKAVKKDKNKKPKMAIKSIKANKDNKAINKTAKSKGRPKTWQKSSNTQVRWYVPNEIISMLKIKSIKEGRSQQAILYDILSKALNQ